MKDYRRLNVAVTRARRQCTLIGDSETLNSDALLQRLVSYFSAEGEHWSAHEFLPEVRFYSAPPPKKSSNINKQKKKKKPNTASKAQSANKQTTSTAIEANATEQKGNAQPVAQESDANLDVTHVSSSPEVTPVKEETSGEEDAEEQSHNIPTPNTNKPNTGAKKKKKKKPANKQPNATKTVKVVNEKDSFVNMTDDEVLEQALKYKNVCHYPQCEKSVAMVGSLCDYCKFKYCYVSRLSLIVH